MSASSSTGCGMSTSTGAYLCWRPRLAAKAAARLAAWSSSPCRIWPRRCGRLSAVWSTAWILSNAVNWSSRSTATCTSGGPTSLVSDPGCDSATWARSSWSRRWICCGSLHSVRGWSDTQLVIRIEAVRRELSLQQAGRAGVDPYRDLPYWLVVLGDPTSTDPWAWRINGHHLLAQATVVGDQVNGVPHFFGAEPATVLEGQHAGLRALPREEDLARELMLALQEDQRRMARIAVKAPADIASRWDPVAALPEQPRGVRYARLDRLQRELLVSLLRQYLDRAACAVANQAWTDITDAGLDQVCFGWAGPVERGAGHYYALSGPSLLIEYDNTQDRANHIHSVWRDLRRDFAGDLLAQHYAGMRH